MLTLSTHQFNNIDIHCIKGNVTDIKVQTVAISCDPQYSLFVGAGKALRQAGGIKFMSAINRMRARSPYGDILHLDANLGNIQSENVMLAPLRNADRDYMDQFYERLIRKVCRLGFNELALPLIGTGSYGLSSQEACSSIKKAFAKIHNIRPLQKLIFVDINMDNPKLYDTISKVLVDSSRPLSQNFGSSPDLDLRATSNHARQTTNQAKNLYTHSRDSLLPTSSRVGCNRGSAYISSQSSTSSAGTPTSQSSSLSSFIVPDSPQSLLSSENSSRFGRSDIDTDEPPTPDSSSDAWSSDVDDSSTPNGYQSEEQPTLGNEILSDVEEENETEEEDYDEEEEEGDSIMARHYASSPDNNNNCAASSTNGNHHHINNNSHHRSTVIEQHHQHIRVISSSSSEDNDTDSGGDDSRQEGEYDQDLIVVPSNDENYSFQTHNNHKNALPNCADRNQNWEIVQFKDIRGYTPTHSTSKNNRIRPPQKRKSSEEPLNPCSICLSEMILEDSCVGGGKLEVVVKLRLCSHSFHEKCIEEAFKTKKRCPLCLIWYSCSEGTQPKNATMDVLKIHGKVLGHPDAVGFYQINYHVPGGIQTEYHPRPGKSYSSTRRTAYLPNNREGTVVLKMLEYAFKKRLVFSIGDSVTTGKKNVPVWNIHHKTSLTGGLSNYGYPDPDYLERVQQELNAHGITKEMIDD